MPQFMAQYAVSAYSGAQDLARLIAQPVLRVALAVPFLFSGLTKWDGFLNPAPAAAYLFENEFKLHLFGGLYSLPFPDTLAYIDGIAEVVLPVLLVIGLGTRFAAFGLLMMTAVIELVVPEGWANFHLPWAALALAIIAIGPGALSLDHWLAKWGNRGANKLAVGQSGT
ncbi:MAG: DoxX family protein [Hyphomicrobiales bacterium]|nr:DoxX family protein [Hyphomicrobiales bacterium]MDE2115732.1 DoxX family protein [Hyphomicrobiales bacterium]